MRRLIALMMCAVSLGAEAQLPDYVPTDGLIGWWPLGEVSSDQSGNQLDGELIETVHTDGFNGLANSATYFNGENSCYVVEGPIPLQGDFTFSFWIRSIIGITDFNPIMILNGGSGCSINSNLEVYMGNGGLTVASNRGTEDFSFYYYNEIAHLEWTHITLTLTGSQMALYTNGILSQIGPIQPFVGEPQPMRIGHFNSAAFDGCDIFFEGSIDDVGFWDEALSNEQIQELFLAPVYGCTNEVACNFTPLANVDDGGCEFVSCHCLDGTVWSAELGGCIVANPADSNFDGCVQLNDLLDLLSAYGDCGAEESAWQCGDPLEYQGYDYETVQIGEQCWFAENARYLPHVSPPSFGSENDEEAHAYVYDYYGSSPSNAQMHPNYIEYGALYNFKAVVDWQLCPVGWHVSNSSDWYTLVDNFGGLSEAGPALMSSSGWVFDNEGNGTNVSGFNGKPAGDRNVPYETFYSMGRYGFFWTSNPEGTGANIFILRSLGEGNAVAQMVYPADFGISVRCIKDTE